MCDENNNLIRSFSIPVNLVKKKEEELKNSPAELLNSMNNTKNMKIDNIIKLTPRSLALAVYNIYLDLGCETLEVLRNEGLTPENNLLDISPRFLTSLYIINYLKNNKYFSIPVNNEENNSLEICEIYINMMIKETKKIYYSKMEFYNFYISRIFSDRSFDFILVQKNFAFLEEEELKFLMYKLLSILNFKGKIIAHHVENFPDIPSGCPLFIFKKVLKVLANLGLSVRTIKHNSPINLRFLCITRKID